MSETIIPEKLTFRRKEVMQLAKLDGRVLDYWESEFNAFSPVSNQSGEKFYSRHDVEIILKIKNIGKGNRISIFLPQNEGLKLIILKTLQIKKK